MARRGNPSNSQDRGQRTLGVQMKRYRAVIAVEFVLAPTYIHETVGWADTDDEAFEMATKREKEMKKNGVLPNGARGRFIDTHA